MFQVTLEFPKWNQSFVYLNMIIFKSFLTALNSFKWKICRRVTPRSYTKFASVQSNWLWLKFCWGWSHQADDMWTYSISVSGPYVHLFGASLSLLACIQPTQPNTGEAERDSSRWLFCSANECSRTETQIWQHQFHFHLHVFVSAEIKISSPHCSCADVSAEWPSADAFLMCSSAYFCPDEHGTRRNNRGSSPSWLIFDVWLVCPCR